MILINTLIKLFKKIVIVHFSLFFFGCAAPVQVNKQLETKNKTLLLNSMSHRKHYAIVKKIDGNKTSIHSGSFVLTSGKHTLITSCSHFESTSNNIELPLKITLLKGHIYQLIPSIKMNYADENPINQNCVSILKDITPKK